MEKNQQQLNWLKSEQLKDKKQLEHSKNLIINELKKIKKEDLFQVPKKISLWRKIMIILLGK
jgi:hypothetical protein